MAYFTFDDKARTFPSTGSLFLYDNGGATYLTCTPLDLFNLLRLTPVNKNISGNFSVSGNQNITGNLTVGARSFFGSTSNDCVLILGSLRHSGDAFHSGNMIVTGDSVLRGNNYFGGGPGTSYNNFANGFLSSGQGFFLNNLNILADANVTGNLRVSGNSTIGDAITDTCRIIGNVHVSGYQNVIGPLNVRGVFTNTGSGHFTSAFRVDGDSFCYGNSYVGDAGSTNYLSGQNLIDSLLVENNSIVNGSSSVVGELSTQSQNYLGDGMFDHSHFAGRIYAKTGIYSEVHSFFKESVTVTGNLYVTGLSILSGNCDVLGKTRVKSDFDAFGYCAANSLRVFGDSVLSGDATINGSLQVDGSITSNGTKWVKFDGEKKAATTITHLGGGVCRLNGLPSTHGVRINDIINVADGDESVYNGSYVATAFTTSTVQYTCGGTPVSNSGPAYIGSVIKANRGITSVVRTSAGVDGDYTITFDTPFSSVDFLCSANCKGNFIVTIDGSDADSASNKRIQVINAVPTNVDSTEIHFIAQI